MTSRDRHLTLALAALTAAAAALRFSTLDLQSFHHDEAVTALRVLQPGFADMLDAVQSSERSGPLYYVAAWLWSQLFGTGEVGLRSLAAVAGTVTVPVAYLAGRELASTRAGLIAAALVAFNPYLVWYSQEARAYPLLVLLVGVGLIAFGHALKAPSGRALAAWAVASALALATHYFALFVIVPEAVWLLYATRDRRAWLAVAGTAAAGLALLPLALEQQAGEREDVFADVSLASRALELLVSFAGSEQPVLGPGEIRVGMSPLSFGLAALVAVLAAGALALLVTRAREDERRGGLTVLGVGLFALAAPFVVAVAGLDLAKPRNLIGALVPLLVAMSAGFGAAGARRWGTAGAVATCGLFATVSLAVSFAPDMQRKDWREVAEPIASSAGTRLVLAPQDGDDPLLLYLEEEGASKEPEGSARVREAYVVTFSDEPPPEPAGSFRLSGREMSFPYYVYRYSSPTPRRIDPAALPLERLVGARPTYLVVGASS